MILLTWGLSAGEAEQSSISLNKYCLNCHQEQQIPNSLIYRRYLQQYSTDTKMEEAILHYLKAPEKTHSIMPAPFFLKFPMKEKMTLPDVILRGNIQVYLKKFNMKKKLILEE